MIHAPQDTVSKMFSHPTSLFGFNTTFWNIHVWRIYGPIYGCTSESQMRQQSTPPPGSACALYITSAKSYFVLLYGKIIAVADRFPIVGNTISFHIAEADHTFDVCFVSSYTRSSPCAARISTNALIGIIVGSFGSKVVPSWERHGNRTYQTVVTDGWFTLLWNQMHVLLPGVLALRNFTPCQITCRGSIRSDTPGSEFRADRPAGGAGKYLFFGTKKALGSYM